MKRPLKLSRRCRRNGRLESSATWTRSARPIFSNGCRLTKLPTCSAILPEEKAEELLGLMEHEEQADVAELLPYEDDTAGGLMTTEFVTLPRELTVGEALARLREMAETPNMIYYLYVVEGEGSWQLAGVIALRSLILADPSIPLDEVMRTEFQRAHPDEPANEVAQRIAEYNLLALPVVDESGDILGIITVDDAMEILLPKDWRQTSTQIVWLE